MPEGSGGAGESVPVLPTTVPVEAQCLRVPAGGETAPLLSLGLRGLVTTGNLLNYPVPRFPLHNIGALRPTC